MRVKGYIKIPSIVMVIIIIILIISYINHKICLKKEDKLFKPIGEVIKIYDNNISIYTEGKGDKTLVFMSGGGTSSPILDFKSLYSQLSDEYRIVVIEKFGYGFSDIVDTKRTIDVILYETREALSKAGINGPYILCPHSMSGIEALYWAQQYPDEVDGIIGLDMAVPEAYANYNINKPLLNLSSFAARIGLTRFIPNISDSDAIKYGNLSKDEKDIYKSVFYRRTGTKTMLNEVDEIKNNALVVEMGGKVNIPMLMLCSNGTGTGCDKEKWHNFQYNYIKDNSESKLIEFNCGHYIHNQEYKNVAKEIKLYLDELYKLDNITDEEILELLQKATELVQGLFRGSSEQIQGEIINEDGILSRPYFNMLVEPYNTPEKRSEEVDKYFTDKDYYSHVYTKGEKLEYGFEQTLYEENGKYYILAGNLGAIFTGTEVISKEIYNDELKVVIGVTGILEYTYEAVFVLEKGVLKIKKVDHYMYDDSKNNE